MASYYWLGAFLIVALVDVAYCTSCNSTVPDTEFCKSALFSKEDAASTNPFSSILPEPVKVNQPIECVNKCLSDTTGACVAISYNEDWTSTAPETVTCDLLKSGGSITAVGDTSKAIFAIA